MLPGQRRPRLRVDVEEARASVPNPPKEDGRTKRGHLSISVFRYDHMFGSLWHRSAYMQISAYQMQLHVHSPSVKVMRRRGYEPSRTMPVYGEHDTVEGVVFLDPQLCSSPGSLTISVSFSHQSMSSNRSIVRSQLEGTFLYVSPTTAAHDATTFGSHAEEYQHRFLYSSVTFPVGESASPLSVTSI